MGVDSNVLLEFQNKILYCLYLWTLNIVRCYREIMLSLFFNLIDDFSPSGSHGWRFQYFILTRVIGNDSPYIPLSSLREFEKYGWQSVNEYKTDQFVFWIVSMNLSVFI